MVLTLAQEDHVPIHHMYKVLIAYAMLPIGGTDVIEQINELNR